MGLYLRRSKYIRADSNTFRIIFFQSLGLETFGIGYSILKENLNSKKVRRSRPQLPDLVPNSCGPAVKSVRYFDVLFLFLTRKMTTAHQIIHNKCILYYVFTIWYVAKIYPK